MTERNLYNGWCDAKTKRRFLCVTLLFYAVAWIAEATGYVNRLEWELLTVAPLLRNDAPIRVTDYDFLQVDSVALGLLCTVAAIVYLAIMTVHRESFKENWYVTLRRIPDYRGTYLRAKLFAVLFPVVLYAVYGILQWSFRWYTYRNRVPKPLRDIGIWKFASAETGGISFLNIVLFAVAVLLLSFVLRNPKKDVIGGLVAIGGIGLMVIVTNVVRFPELWQRVVVLAGVIGVEVLFLVRHVYRKL